MVNITLTPEQREQVKKDMDVTIEMLANEEVEKSLHG